MFERSFIEKVKDKVRISEVVAKKVNLKRRGGEFIGLSPFKQEKTPSFTVNDQKGFYHCFSTGKHGDIINFVMETENSDFSSAVTKICLDFGIEQEFSSEEDLASYRSRSSMLECVSEANNFFKSSLLDEESFSARSYLMERGLSKEDVESFSIGYARKKRSSLNDHLISKGFSQDLILSCGLSLPKKDNLPILDKFSDRIMFPIRNRYGQAIAFGGRRISEEGAKYINSPETDIFKKREVLFNIDKVIKSYNSNEPFIVVEGYMDVIALHKSGFKNAVSPMGTALTTEQVKKIWSFCPDPVFCFDGDEAGLRSSKKALKTCLPEVEPDKTFSICLLSENLDPEEYIEKKGPDAFKSAVSSSMSVCEAIWKFEKDRLSPITTPEKRSLLRREALKLASTVNHKDLGFGFRSEIIKMFSEEFGNKQTSRSKKNSYDIPKDPQIPDLTGRKLEELLIGGMFFFPEIFSNINHLVDDIECYSPECEDIKKQASSIESDASISNIEESLVFNISKDSLDYLMRSKSRIVKSFGSGKLEDDDVSEIWKFNLEKLKRIRQDG